MFTQVTEGCAAFTVRLAALLGQNATAIATTPDLQTGDWLWDVSFQASSRNVARAVRQMTDPRRKAATALALSRKGMNKRQYAVKSVQKEYGVTTASVMEAGWYAGYTAYISKQKGMVSVTLVDRPVHELNEMPLSGCGRTVEEAIYQAFHPSRYPHTLEHFDDLPF